MAIYISKEFVAEALAPEKKSELADFANVLFAMVACGLLGLAFIATTGQEILTAACGAFGSALLLLSIRNIVANQLRIHRNKERDRLMAMFPEAFGRHHAP